jgi:hypothetical protein
MEEGNNNFQNGPVLTEQEKGGAGAIIGAIIIIVLIVLGGIYFWNNTKSVPSETGNSENSISDTEKDLQNEDLDGLDAEFNQELETEL